MSWLRSWSYVVTTVVLCGVCVVLATLLLGYHIYLNYEKCVMKNKSFDRVIFYGSMMSLCSFWLCTSLAWIYRMGDLRLIHTAGWCGTYITLLVMIFTCAKASMFLVLIRRVDTAFEGSAYQHSRILLNSLYMIWCVCYSISIPLIIMFGKGNKVEIKDESTHNGKSICVSSINQYLSLYGLFIDVLFNVLILHLFIKPFKQLFKEKPQISIDGSSPDLSSMNITELEMELIPLKYTIVTSLAVLSTLLSLVLIAVTNAGVLIFIDIVINMISLVIITRKWKHIYWLLCSGFIRCIANNTQCVNSYRTHQINQLHLYYSSLNATTLNKDAESRISQPTMQN